MTTRHPHWLAPLAVLLCVLLAPGCGSSDDKDSGGRYRLHMQRGVQAYTRGDYKQALTYFHKALQFNKDDPHVYLFIGELYDDYIEDKLKAIDYYKGFLKRSDDEELNARVREWIAQAEAAAAGVTPDTGLVTPEDPEAERQKLLAKYARALNTIGTLEKQLEGVRSRLRELEGGGAGRTRPSLLPWLLAGIIGGAAVAVLLVTRMGWLPRRKRPVQHALEAPVLDEEQILGRYFWVENEFNLGTVAIAQENGKIRVESTSLSTNSRSIGYGMLEQDSLRVELTDESGLMAPTVFRFAPDGMSFTAEWTDDLGPGVAIGVRER